jgi:hypothetical protein
MTGASRRSWRSWRSVLSSVFSCAVVLGALAAAGVTGSAVPIVAGSGVQPAGAAGVSHPRATGASGATNASYAVVDSAGGVMTWGGAGFYGDLLATTLTKPIVGSVGDPQGGYWLVASDGGVFAFGQAQFWGSTGNITLNQPIVGMATTPDGNGYWLVASDGGIFAFGDAQFWGSTGNLTLNKPIVGMAATPDGNGYWLVASDGGIFAFGDAQFWGSTGNLTLNKPIVGMAATANGNGYWMTASDGGIFAFGNAQFYGSTGNLTLNQPIVGMTPTPDGNGYWLVAADSGIFTFGDAVFSGSAQSPLHPPFFPAPLSQTIAGTVSIFNDVPGPQATHPDDGIMRVAFSGDSIALYEGQFTINTGPPYLTGNGAAAGCGFTNGAPQHEWSDPTVDYINPGACALWTQQLQWVVTRFHPDVVVLQAGYWECQPRLYNGSYQTLADQDYSSYIASNLTEAIQIAHAGGAAVIVGNALYDADGTPNSIVDVYNQIVQTVVAQFPGVAFELDTHSALDPGNAYAASIDGVAVRGADGVHITQAAVSDFIGPALSQLIANVGPAVYDGTS